ncbi:(Fe-S)-binding protein [Dokdonella sp.]|uniref:(Fe-S)-binding protein n=1 Tax=Dokdonella sp. TaxID=2291710 RepID=UPI001B287FF5|nr:(Fe-S)-binding protein [Dokdonella sp.]MBO9664434.1 (Fe-S)-binding protein [Dokdonella sp.]
MNPMPGAPVSIPADGSPLLTLADQCVQCGLCLPHCPTYRLEAIEAESPRGRIALAKALATGALDPSPSALAHLDHCLGCLSCQKVCPSQVRYDDILALTRADLRARRPAPGRIRRWLRDPARLTRLARLGAALRADRWLPLLAGVLPKGSLARRLALTQAPPPRPAPQRPRSAPATRGRIVLFRGCVASVYDRDTFAAARALLEALGYEVVATSAGACCGALPRHAGEIEAAAATAAATREELRRSGADVVLTSASGCHGDLRDQVANDGAMRVVEIHTFLAADAGFAALRFRPLAARAALHLPCTQVNVAGGVDAIRTLLARIPDLAVLPLPEQPRCCGAAGSYFIEQPEFADRLRAQKLDQAAALQPDMILTTNVGCRLHLGNGLRERAAPLPLRHPLALLAEQLDNSAS